MKEVLIKVFDTGESYFFKVVNDELITDENKIGVYADYEIRKDFIDEYGIELYYENEVSMLLGDLFSLGQEYDIVKIIDGHSKVVVFEYTLPKDDGIPAEIDPDKDMPGINN